MGTEAKCNLNFRPPGPGIGPYLRAMWVGALVAVGGCSAPPAQVSGPQPTPVPGPKTGSAPTPVAVPEPVAAEPTDDASLTAQPGVASPWDYVARAERAHGAQRFSLQLDAVEAFLDLNRPAVAHTLLERLENQPLSPKLAARWRFLLAKGYFADGRYRNVERLLALLSSSTAAGGLAADDELAVETALLRARTLAVRGEPEAALRLLASREPSHDDSGGVGREELAIWRLLARLDDERLDALRQDLAHSVLAQWADLALVDRRHGWDAHSMPAHLERWRTLHRGHPAVRGLIPAMLDELADSITRYRKVALLLPLTSEFGAAARAVYDGFSMMHEADGDPLKPEIAVYDTGDDPELIGFYYQAAVREGAELVIGPLGKQAVDALVAGVGDAQRKIELDAPTLLLGNADVVSGKGAPRNVYQFGLSPEGEVREAALKAFSRGHRVAAALYPETDWGRRQLDAFTAQWAELGGTLVEATAYSPQRQDHSQAVKLLLNVDESESRHQSLERVVGAQLEFSSRPREDLDFVFLIARSVQGRLLKPQLNFHRGAGIPVYAISQIYAGRADRIKDLDLDGVVFGDMPWLLVDSGVYRHLRERLPRGDAYRGQALDRLFAFGVDAYRLLFRLEWMKRDPRRRFRGVTGWLRLAPDGTVSRAIEWARFDQGLARPIPWDAVFASADAPRP